jgi:hypothetical protein
MKSKFHFILLVVLIFDSCNQNSNYNGKNKDAMPIDSLMAKGIIEDNKHTFSIIGKWSMPYTKSAKSTIRCNQCPYAVFEKNNIAKVISPSGEIEVYNYSITNDTLVFSYKGNKKIDSNIYFNDKYLMSIKTEKDYSELELKQIGKDFLCVLRK